MLNNRKKVLDLLKKYEVEFKFYEHSPLFRSKQLEELTFKDFTYFPKNLFLRDDNGKRHFLVVLPFEKHMDLKQIRSEIGSSRLSFGSEERLSTQLEVLPGSVNVFAVLNNNENNVEIFIDNCFKNEDFICFHPNDNTSTFVIKFADVRKILEKEGKTFEFIKIDDIDG